MVKYLYHLGLTRTDKIRTIRFRTNKCKYIRTLRKVQILGSEGLQVVLTVVFYLVDVIFSPIEHKKMNFLTSTDGLGRSCDQMWLNENHCSTVRDKSWMVWSDKQIRTIWDVPFLVSFERNTKKNVFISCKNVVLILLSYVKIAKLIC